jgi:hypothetical protein
VSAPVVDLDRERRVQRNLADLADLLRSDPDLEGRTFAALSGSIPCGLEAPMRTPYAPIRLPDPILDRVDRLIPAVDLRPELIAYGRLSRTAVVRIAVERGLAVLEAELVDELRQLAAEADPKGGTNGK